ncbi:MAG: 4Fe-4S binding protein [Chitinispirillaceae bacterium]|nr:4Fe-4S binding protein [Chitinispirillaceae bacterium]
MDLQRVPCIDMNLCIKCHKCIPVCPHRAITVRKNEDDFTSCTKCVKYCLQFENMTCRPENVCINFEKCDSCGACVEVCEYKAIRWVDKNGK